MAFTLVSHTQFWGNPGGGSTPAIDTTGADLFVIGMSEYGYTATAPPLATDNKGNTFQAIGGTQTSGEATAAMQYARGVGGSGHVFTITASSLYPSFYVAAFNGSIATPLNQSSGAPSNRPGSITPTVSNALIVSVGVGGPGTTAGGIGVDSGFGILEAVGYAGGNCEGGALAYLLQSAPAAVNPTWSGLGGPAALIASFAPAAIAALASNAPALMVGA